MADDIDTRLAEEVASLSTKLVTEVARLLQLEETVYHLRRENHAYKQKVDELAYTDVANSQLTAQVAQLNDVVTALTAEKHASKEKNAQLEAEVEELTASLFNEANEMVSNASRETYNFKVKNRKLIEELAEKDTIIADLQSQLLHLKTLFQDMEEQTRALEASAASTPYAEHSGDFEANRLNIASDRRVDELDLVVYSPRARSIRFDLSGYLREFKGFVYQVGRLEFSFDLPSLKTLKYFRRVFSEEIEPCLTHVPTPTGTFINRWATGKTFWSFLVEGKARIEPVSGVNETFKVSYKGAKTGLEVPIAIRDPCEFCGEQNELRLEHARLYNLKLYTPVRELKDPDLDFTTDIGGESHLTVGLYPLCNYCLVKLRAICEFFAKLRLIHANIYKINPNSLYNEIGTVSSFQFKKSQESLIIPQLRIEDEPVFVKLYLLLLAIRAKIYWSRAGFWDTDEDVELMNVDETKLETFKEFVSTNVSFQEYRLNVVDEDPETEKEGQVEKRIGEEEKNEDKIGAGNAGEEKLGEEKVWENEEEEDKAKLGKDDAEENSKTGQEKTVENEKEENMKEGTEENLDESETFHDTSERLEEVPKPVTRKKSKSKAFKRKMNRDLDNTIEMLKENLR